MVFTKQAKKNIRGVWYAPGRDMNADNQSSYMMFRLCENYDGQVKGGIRKTWRMCANNLSLQMAKDLFEKKLGYKIYS